MARGIGRVACRRGATLGSLYTRGLFSRKKKLAPASGGAYARESASELPCFVSTDHVARNFG